MILNFIKLLSSSSGLCGVWNTLLSPLLPGPHWAAAVVPIRALFMIQIYLLLNYSYLIIILDSIQLTIVLSIVTWSYDCLISILSIVPWNHIKVKLSTVVEGNPKAPFSIATTPKCWEGATPFPGLLHFALDPYLTMLC